MQGIFFGVPHKSIFRPLLFNIFLCDLFLTVKFFNIASYADKTEKKQVIVIGNKVNNNTNGKLLGITIHSKLALNENVNKRFDKASQKLNALEKFLSLISLKKKGNYDHIR